MEVKSRAELAASLKQAADALSGAADSLASMDAPDQADRLEVLEQDARENFAFAQWAMDRTAEQYPNISKQVISND